MEATKQSDGFKPVNRTWIGAIPEKWEAAMLKLVARLESGHTPSRSVPAYWENCSIPWFSLADVWQLREEKRKYVYETSENVSELGVANSSARVLPAGTVMLSRTASVGFTGIMGCEMATTQDFVNWVCGDRLRPEYLWYCLQAMTPEYDRLRFGSTHQTIYMPDVAQFKVPLPTCTEQERIANFLDEQTVRIDALISEKQKLLAATREYFTARLGTAVVLGLKAKRKLVAAESKGFEAVPEDWALVPLKHLATSSGGMTPSKDREDYWVGDIPWVSPKDMKRFVLNDSMDHISQSALDNTSLRLNPIDSVLVVVRGMILAHTFPVALNAVPVTINQDMKALRANSRISAKYLAWMLRGLQPLMLSLTEESAHGTKALRTDQWANQCVPLPPTEEQASLVSAFEAWEAESASLAAHLELHIERLREYRSSLISAAVTGQLDVGSFKEGCMTALPPHGPLACRRCFPSSGNEWDFSNSDGSRWRLEHSPAAFGGSNPGVLVLGFSKGVNQSRPGLAFDDIAFKGMRKQLADILRSLNLLSRPIDSCIRAVEERFAFGSLVRCSVSQWDSKTGEHTKSGNSILQKFAKGDATGRVARNCVDQFLRELPQRTKLVVMLGNEARYIEFCKQEVGLVRGALKPVNARQLRR